MKKIYSKAFLFWFVLLVIAILNAIIRELTYKPLLEPYIGFWAHQISSITGILLFFIAIFFFVKGFKEKNTNKELIFVGLIWIFLTVLFETLMGLFIRDMNLYQVMQTYFFWKGETWIFVLLSLVISPLIAKNSWIQKINYSHISLINFKINFK